MSEGSEVEVSIIIAAWKSLARNRTLFLPLPPQSDKHFLIGDWDRTNATTLLFYK